MKDLHKRLLTGILGSILLILIVLKNGFLLSASTFIVSIIGIRELYRAFENIDLHPNYFIGYFGSLLLFLSSFIGINYLSLIIVIITMITIIYMVIDKNFGIIDATVTLFAIMYISFMLLHIVFIEESKYTFLIFIIAFGTDTFAYFAGNLLGKRKLCPEISPNKTVEGSIGGVVGSIFLLVIYSKLVNIGLNWKLIFLVILASIIAQMGDLIASRIKRIVGIKDYGFIIPGHGGVLDRFDSIILTAPIIYYYYYLFILI